VGDSELKYSIRQGGSAELVRHSYGTLLTTNHLRASLKDDRLDGRSAGAFRIRTAPTPDCSSFQVNSSLIKNHAYRLGKPFKIEPCRGPLTIAIGECLPSDAYERALFPDCTEAGVRNVTELDRTAAFTVWPDVQRRPT
jgi:hypothetical protein